MPFSIALLDILNDAHERLGMPSATVSEVSRAWNLGSTRATHQVRYFNLRLAHMDVMYSRLAGPVFRGYVHCQGRINFRHVVARKLRALNALTILVLGDG
jgi:hypothetical protein